MIEGLEGLFDTAAGMVERAVVLVHVPKTAGTALLQTARQAGWGVVEWDVVAAATGACPHCGPRGCSEVRDRPSAPPRADVQGLVVSVGQRPVEVGLAVAGRLRHGGVATRVVIGVRDPEARLTSMFRYYWRDAFAGGVVGLARALRSVRRSGSVTRIVGAALPRLQEARARTHDGRIMRRRALDALHYVRHERGRLVIDGESWLRAFARYGPGAPYWLDEYVSDPDRLRLLRDEGDIELLATTRLDSFTRAVLGAPSVRSNVSAGAVPPSVERALDLARDGFVGLAARDVAFGSLVAEAAVGSSGPTWP